jgi:hypothetical protein
MPPDFTIDAGLHLLDRQLVAADDRFVGKVDDLELDLPEDGGLPVVTAILCGPLALGPRIGGRLGAWWAAVGRRLRDRTDSEPLRIGFGAVADIGTAVTLTIRSEQASTLRLEHWMDDKLVRRLPGADHAAG